MKPASREIFRHNLLIQLEAVAPSALPVATLRVGALAGGFEVDAPAVEAELAYLADKGFVAKAEKQISPENAHWRITASGRDYAAEKGLA